MNLNSLPEDCLAHILSYAYPKDACSLSLVSSAIRSLSDSDIVWEKFLPSDYLQILSQFACPIHYSSKKELFLELCKPHLLDGGKKIFSLEKSTGKKRYMISARDLSITWATNPLYWSWKPDIHSRFSESVELRTICWLQIEGKFDTKKLSPRTQYGVFIVFDLADRAYGLDTLPSDVSVQFGDFKSESKVYVCDHRKRHGLLVASCNFTVDKIEESTKWPYKREDGWIEIELGSFYSGECDRESDKELFMLLKEVTGEHLKGGLIVEGIEIRPKLSH